MAIADLERRLASPAGGHRSLNLSGCSLKELPREVLDHADTLEELDLSSNQLSDLPTDFAKLTRLRRLFCSHNPYDVLPSVLGDCRSLSQIGFRGCGLKELPSEALPQSIRWLTLTDNKLEDLPRQLGERASLQKLMLAGNQLRSLPETLAGAANLELLRVSANDLRALPSWIDEMPALSWLAFGGNPCESRPVELPAAAIPWDELHLGPSIGEGASGRVYAARWVQHGERSVAVKLFKGSMTSDGLPECERAACLAAGPHPNLVGAFGFVQDHPDGTNGLVMPLVPAGWRVLGSPPNAESCSRDVYSSNFRLTSNAALRIARCVGEAVAHLHSVGLMHGDIYAHNTFWDGFAGEARLSDFGAASFLKGQNARHLERVEVRAWAVLVGELFNLCERKASPGIQSLLQRCSATNLTSRPNMLETLDALADTM